jgi:hypothetical protein
VVPTRDSHTGRVAEQFREVFETWRGKTMPTGVDASAWNQVYRLGVNTTALTPADLYRGMDVQSG